MPDKPTGKKAAAQFVKGGAVEVFIHPGKDRDFMLEDGKVFKKKKYYG